MKNEKKYFQYQKPTIIVIPFYTEDVVTESDTSFIMEEYDVTTNAPNFWGE